MKSRELRNYTPSAPARMSRSVNSARAPRKSGRLASLAGKQKPTRKCPGPVATLSKDLSKVSIVSDAGGRSVLGSSWRLPGYLGEQGKDQLGELCSILREELAACYTQKQVAHVNRTTMKMVCEGSADDHVSGRLAYRLKEAVRDIGSVSNYAALDCRHQLAFRKVLQLEVRRRQAEIAGYNEQAAEELALVTELIDKEYGSQALVPPLVPALRVQQKQQAPEALTPIAPRTPQSESTSGSPKRVRHSLVAANASHGALGDCLTSHKHWMEEHPSNPSMPQQPREEEELSRMARAVAAPDVGTGPSKKIDDFLAETEIVAEKEKAFNNDDNQIVKVFNNLAEMSGIIKDNIAPALRLLGMPEPNQAWIDEVFEGIQTKFATLTEAEFMKFVTRYVNRQSKAYAQSFFECDADKSGEVEYEELKELLTRFGITPMPHVLDEIIKEVDKDSSGALSLREFESVMDLVRLREGFSKAEHAVLVDTFGKFDHDKCGEIKTTQILNIIVWLGFAYDAEKVESIVKEVDFDGGGSLNVVEFLACMRKMRENELKQADEIMKRLDFDGDGRTGVEELRPLIGSLGYTVDIDAIMESAVRAGIDVASSGLDIVQVWQLLVVYRSHEGFSAADTADIQEAFDKYDKAGQGEMTIVEASKVLRWLGFTPSFEVHQNLVAKVDIDKSGKLEFHEFLKMVRILQSGEEAKVMDAFRRTEHRQALPNGLTPVAPGYLLKENALEALREAGIARPDLHSEDCVTLPDGRLGVAMDSFISFATRIQKEARRDYRKNSGFSSDEIREMQECFDYFDADGSGDVSCKETVQLIEELFPNQAHDPKVRPKLVQLMVEVDADSSGSLNFSDFLHLMQELQELKMQERITRELAAFEECQFTVKEMEEFRELFLSSGNEAGGETESLSFPHVQKMLGALFPLGEKKRDRVDCYCQGHRWKGRWPLR